MNQFFESYPPSNESEIEKLEQQLQQKLPIDFKNFLLITNGAIINCQWLFGIKPGNRVEDLFDNYIWETKEAGNPMPDYCLPLMGDGFGNHNCLDLKSLSTDGKTCKVIFWQHDRLYDSPTNPDIDADSFTEFLEIMVKASV